MGLPDIAVQNITPPFHALVEQLHIEPIFSFWLKSAANSQDEGAGGELMLGGVDETRYEGELRYVKVTPKPRNPGYWMFDLDAISVGGFGARDISFVIADTGTSLLVMPANVSDRINNEIGATKGSMGPQYTVDCSRIPSMPDVTFVIGGFNYTLTAQQYVLQIQGQCVSTFMGHEFKIPVWILGDAFLRVVRDFHPRCAITSWGSHSNILLASTTQFTTLLILHVWASLKPNSEYRIGHLLGRTSIIANIFSSNREDRYISILDTHRYRTSSLRARFQTPSHHQRA